jgi:ribonuclease HII
MDTPSDMLLFENKEYAEGALCVCGIDEAGRGPLAGPVFAAAVVLPRGCVIEGVNDSKKLSAKKRAGLFDVIISRAVSYAVASADEKEIDSLNILRAAMLAMRRAYSALGATPDCALVDGNTDPGLGCRTLCIIKGDGRSESVAAASILAKVSRDRYMTALAEKYPQYGFEKHKGYPTADHYRAIIEHGPCAAHRMSFLKNLDEKRAEFAHR